MMNLLAESNLLASFIGYLIYWLESDLLAVLKQLLKLETNESIERNVPDILTSCLSGRHIHFDTLIHFDTIPKKLDLTDMPGIQKDIPFIIKHLRHERVIESLDDPPVVEIFTRLCLSP